MVRFPTWAHCPSCKRLDRHNRLTSIFKNECNACGIALIPSRFIICCANGHVDDFPYFSWVHAGSPRMDGEHRMTIDSAGNTASLGDIVITLHMPESERRWKAPSTRHAMKGVTACKGRRPWLSDHDAACDEMPRTLQRGASNVWFSLTHSAISIPPWSEGAFLVLNKHWEILRHLRDEDALRSVLDSMQLADGTIYSTDDLVAAVIQRRAGETADDDDVTRSLKRDEYLALLNGRPEQSRDQQFVCVPAAEVPGSLSELIERVMLVKKLREVRVLESFSRIAPPGAGPGSAAAAPLRRLTPAGCRPSRSTAKVFS